MTDELKAMKIYIVTTDFDAFQAVNREFVRDRNVEAWYGDVRKFMDQVDSVECLVSPGNAFGLMTGGYDAALSDILGWDFQKKVQWYIQNMYYGEQIVGTSFIIDTEVKNMRLIHTPTMRYPSAIKDEMVVYYCMKSTLMCALNNHVKSIVIPVFGASTGRVFPALAAKLMKDAYDQVLNQQWAERMF